MSFPSLSQLDFLPYIDPTGAIAPDFEQKIGIYAIFDGTANLCYVGYSRDCQKSLQQHLVRRPFLCHWIKLHTCEQPNRTLMEDIKTAWLEEHGTVPPGNDHEEHLWTEPIDIKKTLTPEQKAELEAAEELVRSKLLKDHARRVEDRLLERLSARGLKIELRFQPKLKEQGLLDLK